MPRRFTVEDWLNIILPTEEKIETVVRYGPDIVCGRKVPAGSALTEHRECWKPGVLSVEITKARITIQARPKDITV